MKGPKLGESVDLRIASASEGLLRRMSRRDAIRTGVLGGVGAIAALAVGVKPAWAFTCSCGPTYRCNHWGDPCPAEGCPSGYVLCQNDSSAYCSCINKHYNVQGYCCEYSSGSWTTCTGICGTYGYKICYDCIKSGGCDHWCTCLGDYAYCCGCNTPEDVYEEMARARSRTAAMN